MFISIRTLTIVCLVCFILGGCIGAWGEYTWGPRLTEKQITERTVEKPVITEKIVTRTDTQIAYVPKETIKYIDAQTGQEVEKQLDGKFTIGKPDFTYTLNGKVGKFTKTDDEKFIFEKNMVELNQTSKVNIDIKTLEQPRAKIGAYAEVSQDLGGEAGVIAAYQSRKFDVELKYNNERQGKLQFNAWL
jgi:hypothetical protein